MSQPSLLLDDYLERPDFGTALIELAGDLRTRARLPDKIDELGLVCSDVQKAAEMLESTYKGMKIYFLGDGSPKFFREKGKDVSFRTRVGFGFYKGVIMELAEPGEGSNIFAQTAIIDDKIMINHLGFKARSAGLTRLNNGTKVSYTKIMADLGIPKAVEGEVRVMGLSTNIHIFETMHLTNGVEIEFLDFRLFNPNGPKFVYPAGAISLLGWQQKNIGPRFFKF